MFNPQPKAGMKPSKKAKVIRDLKEVIASRSSSTVEHPPCKREVSCSSQESGSKANNIKKEKQLGMSPGTASGRLKKEIMFNLLSRLGENICFQCLKTIDSADELSVEHKTPWLNSEDPVGLFYDPENIAFSHLKCNSSAARRPSKIYDDPRDADRAHDRKRSKRPERIAAMKTYRKEYAKKKTVAPVSLTENVSLTGGFDRKTYQRDLMRKRRANV